MMENNISRQELEKKKLITLKNGQVLSWDFYEHVSKENDNWNVPTEILYGSRDDLVYIENIADFLGKHPLSKLTISENSEHYFYTEKVILSNDRTINVKMIQK